MPKRADSLSAMAIKKMTHPGGTKPVTRAVGDVPGLLLQITPGGAKSWLLRVMIGGKRREIGLGSYPEVSLAEAQSRARADRDKVRSGVDPVAERKEAKARLVEAQKVGLTFREAAEQCLEARLHNFKNAKHRDQWSSTLEQYVYPIIGSMPVQGVDTASILRVLKQDVFDKSGRSLGTFWMARTETATRVRGRIEAVLTTATVAGHRRGDNPARWVGHLKELLPDPNVVGREANHPAVAVDDAPRWYADLLYRDGFGARALEFVALTASRSGPVRRATWGEIDLHNKVWVVPAAHMKTGKQHRVPLSERALALLANLPRLNSTDLIFPGKGNRIMSDMTPAGVMRRMHADAVAKNGGEPSAGYLDAKLKRPAVPHGLRSTFSDWAADKTDYPRDLREMALAHALPSAVEEAYRRGDMMEKRRTMMQDWADYLSSAVPNNDEMA